jgi:hypothetical protein
MSDPSYDCCPPEPTDIELRLAAALADNAKLREELKLAADELDYMIPFVGSVVKASAKARRDAARAALEGDT